MLKYISILFSLTLLSCNNSAVIPVSKKNTIQDFKPKDSVKFPHAIHTEVNKIDCNYCHTPNVDSQSNEVKNENNCVNCHKTVSGK